MSSATRLDFQSWTGFPVPEIVTGEHAVALNAFTVIHRSKGVNVKAAHQALASVKREVHGSDLALAATPKRSASPVERAAEMLAPKRKDKLK